MANGTEMEPTHADMERLRSQQSERRLVADLVAELRDLATIWDPAIHHSELLLEAADRLDAIEQRAAGDG